MIFSWHETIKIIIDFICSDTSIMINKEISKKDFIIQLFVAIDDMYQMLWMFPWKKVWRPRKMWPSEVITCMLFGIFTWYKTIKDLHRDLISYHQDSFNIPSYKSFVDAVNNYGRDALLLLCAFVQMNRNMSWWRLKFIDATPVAVCNNKRIFDHKVCDWFAERGKSTMWWFFGFKLHMIVDECWNLLAFTISPGNVDDRKVVKKMVRKLTWKLIADAWYVSWKLIDDLSEMWITFLSWYKKNMKKLVTYEYLRLHKLRQIVETWFGMMKCWWTLVSSYARSVWGHLSRLIYNLLGYCVRRNGSKGEFAIS